MKENINNEKKVIPKKTLKELQDEIKKVRDDARAHGVKQSKKIKELEDQLKEHSAYKQLIITATKTHNDPHKIVEGLKLTAENIKARNWPMVDRVGGSSGDIEARGACPICRINLVGKDLRPREITFPCGVAGCPYERERKNI